MKMFEFLCKSGIIFKRNVFVGNVLNLKGIKHKDKFASKKITGGNVI